MQGTTLKGKTALVTGSTSGIGLGIARALAAQGDHQAAGGHGQGIRHQDLLSQCGHVAADRNRTDDA
jgi:NAD(P)-dependent dehydrogenase (short-subunit alcohol dehydrogenase family)